MSRHRNIRSMNVREEYEGYDDVYGHSVEDDCVSPTDAANWIYDRNRSQQSRSEFLANHRDIEEENEDDMAPHRRDSESYEWPELNPMDRAKLLSCMEEIRNIVGDTISEKQLVETIVGQNFDMESALNAVLNFNKTPPTMPKLPSKPVAMEKGIGDRLLEKATVKLQPTKPTITVTPTTKKANVTRGFEVNSPVTSGRNTPEPQPPPKSKEATRNAKELYDSERGGLKPTLHMVVTGHVDAGKSTLMGHLLFDMGNVPQRVMHKHEQESKKLGKQSFMYAWVLDETGEERERGITMDVGSSRFDTKTKQVTLLDAPGHKDFIPNMISGATQADVALLVVDATRGEFETGFEQGGQTREHALLVRSLGVSQLGVVVNKLDTVGWSQERFNEITSKLKLFLKQAGFKDSDISYIPCSGLTGENLVKPPTDPKLTCWYQGPTLLTVIDSFKIPERAIEKPFRMSISDVFKGTTSGFCVSGRIESGALSVNDKVLVCPNKENAQVKTIQIDEMPCTNAFAGDQVSVTLSGIDVANLSIGFIVCDQVNPIPLTTRIKARILVFNIKAPITIGFPVVLHHQSLIEPATVVKLKAQLHKGTGEVLKKNPRCLGNNSCALVEIDFQRQICMERYADYKDLGRFMLRVAGVTIAAGVVTDIVK